MSDDALCSDQEADALDDQMARLRAEITRLRRIEQIAVEFCTRCERGEIRSTSTYLRFKTALRLGTSLAGDRKVRQQNDGYGDRTES